MLGVQNAQLLLLRTPKWVVATSEPRQASVRRSRHIALARQNVPLLISDWEDGHAILTPFCGTISMPGASQIVLDAKIGGW